MYVKSSAQNAGNGFKIWKAIEELHPETRIWETHTPYYDKRNIHFYVNRCGFKIVEFFNPKHKDPHQISETTGNIPKEKVVSSIGPVDKGNVWAEKSYSQPIFHP